MLKNPLIWQLCKFEGSKLRLHFLLEYPIIYGTLKKCTTFKCDDLPDQNTFENILMNNKLTITFLNKSGVEKLTKMTICKDLNTILTEDYYSPEAKTTRHARTLILVAVDLTVTCVMYM